MPRCKIPGTLQDLSINSIARNVGYWTQDYEEHLLDKGKFRHLLGPFDELPSPVLVQELANELIRQKKLTRSSLHLLINGGFLQQLDFSDCPRLITDEVIYMIADKCKKVRSLNLAGCSRVTAQAMEVLSSNLPYAVRLDFSKTRIGPLALQSVFRLCGDLQELKLKHCQVCDNDIGVLCNIAMQKEQFGLRKLDLSSSMVTDMGIRALLRSIPYLQELQYSNLIHCIIAELPITEEFEIQYLSSSPPAIGTSRSACANRDKVQNSLQRLECSDFSHVTDHHLKLIAFLCPGLVSLDLRCARGFSKSGLSDLLYLDHLRELKLASSDDLSFRNGLDGYLMKHGNKLTVLSLEDFDGLNLNLIGQLCPNLCKLLVFMMSDSASFSSTSQYTSSRRGHLPFCHLEELALWCTNDNATLTPDMLSTVFINCNALRSLEVIRVATFTDSIMEEAIQSHGFAELRSMSLHECNAVTSGSISQLFHDRRNVLESLVLMDCFAITRRDYEGWCKLVKRRNYNLLVRWK